MVYQCQPAHPCARQRFGAVGTNAAESGQEYMLVRKFVEAAVAQQNMSAFELRRDRVHSAEFTVWRLITQMRHVIHSQYRIAHEHAASQALRLGLSIFHLVCGIFHIGSRRVVKTHTEDMFGIGRRGLCRLAQ